MKSGERSRELHLGLSTQRESVRASAADVWLRLASVAKAITLLAVASSRDGYYSLIVDETPSDIVNMFKSLRLVCLMSYDVLDPRSVSFGAHKGHTD